PPPSRRIRTPLRLGIHDGCYHRTAPPGLPICKILLPRRTPASLEFLHPRPHRDLGGPGAVGLMDDVQVGGCDRIGIEQACRLVASQANARAPVSVTNAARSSVLRAASATVYPSCASSRASAAERPEPAPTMRAVENLTASNLASAMAHLLHILAKMRAGYHVRRRGT